VFDGSCPAFCNNQARRLWRDHKAAVQQWHDDDPQTRGEPPVAPQVVVTQGEPVFCRSCTAQVRRCLIALDDLMSLLLTMADGHRAVGKKNEQVRASRSVRSPSPAHDDLDELVRWLGDFEQKYRSSQGWLAASGRGVNAPTLTGQVSWLSAHLDSILGIKSIATDFGLGVLRRHSTLQDKTQTRPPVYHKPLPCPRCTRFSLFRHDDDTVRCHNAKCNRVMAKEDYEELEAQADLQIIGNAG
jgi:hypothetical protein